MDGYPRDSEYPGPESGLTYDDWYLQQEWEAGDKLAMAAEQRQAAVENTLWDAYRKVFDRAIFAEMDWQATRITIAAFSEAKAQCRAAQDAYIAELKRRG